MKQSNFAGGRRLQRRIAAFTLIYLKTKAAKIFGEQQTHVCIVIDYQQAFTCELALYL